MAIVIGPFPKWASKSVGKIYIVCKSYIMRGMGTPILPLPKPTIIKSLPLSADDNYQEIT
jgi:hypothetical protein